MDNRCFKLKRSLCALAFQLFIFALLMYLLYQLLSIALWAVCAVIGLVIYQLFYRKTPKIEQFVVYFQHAKARPLLIWCDQLPFKQWKSLKLLTKLI